MVVQHKGGKSLNSGTSLSIFTFTGVELQHSTQNWAKFSSGYEGTSCPLFNLTFFERDSLNSSNMKSGLKCDANSLRLYRLNGALSKSSNF